MAIVKPTMQLRFVEKDVEVSEGVTKKLRVLQQLFYTCDDKEVVQYWEDVPFVDIKQEQI